jgi:hypothetical protein
MQTKKAVFTTLAVAGLVSHVCAQALDIDWLYLSPNGSWLSKTESLISEQSQLNLPVDSLQSHQFWWQSDNPDVQLSWKQADPMGLPKKGTPVEIAGESGLWLIKEVNANHLVLQQGRDVRYWPQSQWHLLTWTSTDDQGMSLTVRQAEKRKSELFYAWQNMNVQAEVRYRLDEDERGAYLHQELIISNLSDTDYVASGYSYAQQTGQPQVMAMRMAVESDAFVSAPVASESQGVPTLVSKEPVQLSAMSHLWLPVSTTELSDVSRDYRLQWDTRSQGLQNAQMSILLTSRDSLPDIAGPIKIGVFDQQIAVMESQYQPSTEKSAELNLGSSALVSMESSRVGEGQWKLLFSNRSEESAAVEFLVQHWDGKQNQRVPMTIRLDANSEKTVDIELATGGKIRIAK